jgi:hypothetical protein
MREAARQGPGSTATRERVPRHLRGAHVLARGPAETPSRQGTRGLAQQRLHTLPGSQGLAESILENLTQQAQVLHPSVRDSRTVRFRGERATLLRSPGARPVEGSAARARRQPNSESARITEAQQALKREKEARTPTKAEMAEHKRRRDREGCVTRSLASALRVEPTYGQWQMRFNQIDRFKEQFKLTSATPPAERRRILDGAREAEERNILELFQAYDTHGDTPLGRALQKMDIDAHGTLSADRIKDLIRDGKETGRQVLINGAVVDSNNQVVGRHMVHVGMDREGELVALSDGNRPIDLNTFGQFNTLTLSPTKNDGQPARLTISREAKTPEHARQDHIVYPAAV